MTRKKELDKGRKAILNLIDHLDQKKDEVGAARTRGLQRSYPLTSHTHQHQAIERTFKGIAKHFSTVPFRATTAHETLYHHCCPPH